MGAPLAHKRILLTRSSRDNQAWMRELARRGLAGVDLPCIETTLLESAAEPLGSLLLACQGLLFTSPRAVRAVHELCPGLDLSEHFSACVGDATAQALEGIGGQVHLKAPMATARSLGQAWLETVPPSIAALWPRALEARVELEPLFEAQGRPLQSLPIYRTSPRTDIDHGLVEDLDAVFFASPSAARAFSVGGRPPAHIPVISIGPSTTEALEASGISVAGEARTRDLDGLLDALTHHLSSNSRSA